MNKFKRTSPDRSKQTSIAKKFDKDDSLVEYWVNDLYFVQVNRHMSSGIGEYKMTWLSIKRNDNRALMDWRHMQEIKNELVGLENEGVEIFPAESRLVDGANQYHLWVFEDPEFRFPFGFDERGVSEKSFFGQTQRKFEKKPHDLEEQHKKIQKMIDENKDLI